MQRVVAAMEPHMQPDRYGRSTVRNIYYDTADYILARHSIARPDFKEKLRIRSYSQASGESDVFVELKRKYDHIVYKRRVALPEKSAMAWMTGARSAAFRGGEALSWAITGHEAGNAAFRKMSGGKVSPQMAAEIDYFLDYYRDLHPAVFLSYDRIAYRMRDEAGRSASDLRVTFDSNILCRDYDLSLRSEVYGDPLMDGEMVLMELKCSGGIPLWMTEILSTEHIYKTSFSKYGTAYTKYILPELQTSATQSNTEPVPMDTQETVGTHRPHFGWHPVQALAKFARVSMF